jgi:hypothetical protein
MLLESALSGEMLLVSPMHRKALHMSISVYSDALRAIGRDLDLRGIRTFVLRSEPDVFLVEGGYQPPPAIMPVTLHYTLCDIERLNREAQERMIISRRSKTL